MGAVRQLAGCLLVLATACAPSPEDDLEDFVARADRAQPDAGAAPPGALHDLSGRWLMRLLLAGGLDLGLKLRIRMVLGQTPPPIEIDFWPARIDDATTPPAFSAAGTVGADGSFEVVIDPLVLGPEATPSGRPIRARLALSTRTLAADELCGEASGSVTEPLSLDLAGSTFHARRDEAGSLALADLLTQCPSGPARPTTPPAPPPAGPERPAAPDLSGVSTRLADVSGDYYFSALLAGVVPLQAHLRLAYRPGATGGAIDGVLMRLADAPGAPAAATFSAAVDASGRFEIWLPDFRGQRPDGVTVEATLLLATGILDADRICGLGAGTVRAPLMLDLAGTTFHAARWDPATPAPEAAPAACP